MNDLPPYRKVVLGLDPSTKLIGWSFIDYETGEFLWNGVNKINVPSGGFREAQIAKVIGKLYDALCQKDEDYSVQVVGIEKMFLGPSPKISMELSYVAGQVHQCVSQVFKKTEVIRLIPPEWREANGLARNASKSALKQRADELGLAAATSNQDAVDAGFIALAARKRHRTTV